MTKLRRVAQFVEDLKTLGIITSEQVHSMPSLNDGISVIIDVPESDKHTYSFIQDLLNQEFTTDIKILATPLSFVQFVLKY